MAARPKKKMLWCDSCDGKKMCYASSSFMYQCKSCGSHVNVVKAAGIAKRKREEAREAKLGGELVNEAYMAFVREQPCRRPGCGAVPSDPHHSVHRSQGRDDRTCMPLCAQHHREYHDKFGSVPAALAGWGIDLRAEARTLYNEFTNAADDGEPQL